MAVNIFASVMRMAAGVIFGLFSSRLLLAYLGESGLGVLTAMGASGVFLVFFALALGRGMQREIAFHSGRSDWDAAQKVFTMVTALFTVFSILFICIMLAVKPWVLRLMSFPPESSSVVGIVYVISMFQISAYIFAAPFRGVLEGTQNLATISIFEMALAGLNLVFMVLLPYFPGDKLLVASGVQATLAGFTVAGMVVISRWRCPEVARFVRGGAISHLRSVAGITSWSLFGHLSWISRNEGTVFALNVFFGPAVNASYSLALRVNALQNELAFAIARAVQPALTAAVSTGDGDRARSLTLLGSKLPCLAGLFVWIPLLFCAEDFLYVWLGRVPEHAALFVRILGVSMLGLVSYGHQMALESRNRMAGVTLWMTLPPVGSFLLWCLFQSHWPLPLWSLPAMQAVLGMILVFGVRPFLHGAILGIAAREWFWKAFWPMAVVHSAGVLAAIPAWLYLPVGLERLLGVGVLSGIGMAAAIWFKGLDSVEKSELLVFVKKAKIRLGARQTTA